MLFEWREFCTMTKIFCVCGLVSLMGLTIMILTGITSIGAIWELLKRCPLCM
jgi:hypothetical protein